MSLVSVVVPTYNSEHYIVETLESILGQTYQDIEVVVTDHGSTDNTWTKIQPYRERPNVRIERIEPGGGAARNWNAATSLARGSFLKLVCADDLLRPDCIERQAHALVAAGEGAVMAASRRDIIGGRGRTLVRAWGLGGLQGRQSPDVVLREVVRSGTNILGEPACVLFRREALVAAGGWHGQDGYVIDLRTYLRVLEHGDLIAMPETLAAFRVSRQQWSVRLEREQSRQVEALLNEVAERLPERVSVRDVARGRRRARRAAWQRRLFYRVMNRHM